MNHIQCIVLHENPHLDEFGAVVLLREYGKRFGITRQTPVRFIPATSILTTTEPKLIAILAEFGCSETDALHCGSDANSLEREHGVLFVGTGGGRFDEHPREGVERTNTSSIRLIAKELADFIPHELSELIDYIDEEDARHTRTYCGPMELSQIMRTLINNDVSFDRIYDILARIMRGVATGKTINTSPPFRIDTLIYEWVKKRCGEKDKSYSARNAFNLMLEIGLNENPAFDQIREYVKRLDARASSGEVINLELAFLPDFIQADNSSLEADENAWDVAEWILDQKFEEQDRFFTEGKQEYDRVRELYAINLKRGVLNIVFCESSMYGLDRVARKNDTAGIIVMRDGETGNVRILTTFIILRNLGLGNFNQQTGLKTHLDVLARMIRIRERELAHDTKPYDANELANDGIVSGADNWYYDRRVPWLLNGSRSAMNVAPTRIPWDELKSIVLAAFDETKMTEVCQDSGVCARQLCSAGLYRYNLGRCHALRQRETVHGESEGYAFTDDSFTEE